MNESESRYRLCRPDGTMRHVLARISVTERGDNGGATRLVGVLIDVTELQEAADRVIETLESISDAHVSVDADWRFTYVNARAEQLLGSTKHDLLGRSLFGEFPDVIGSEFETHLLAAQETVVEFEAFYPRHQRWYEVRAYPLRRGVSIYFRDVSERHAAQAERERLLAAEMDARQAAERATAALAHQATHDPLTGLANRHELHRWITAALQRGDRLAVLFLDLDRFKKVNDTFGHRTGDQVIIEIARRLREHARSGDLITRFGGDEFIVAMTIDAVAEVAAVAERLMAEMREPVDTHGPTVMLSASIGIAVSGDPSLTDHDTLIRDADLALYRAKQQGRNQIVWFDAAQHEAIVARLHLESELRHTIANGQLRLHFQPSYDLSTSQPCGAEALLRWQHPHRGLLLPGEFIGLAEETGLIIPIGDWVMTHTAQCRQRWTTLPDGFVIWANASIHELNRPGFAERLLASLDDIGLATHRFGVEVTESVYSDDATIPADELRQLRSDGVSIALDDFGTGYSSLSRLRAFPADVIKIDRSFVEELESNVSARAIVTTIIDLARAIGSTTVAEGVETVEQLHILRELGCDTVSGFLLARPTPMRHFLDVVAEGQHRLTTAGNASPPTPCTAQGTPACPARLLVAEAVSTCRSPV